MNAEELQEIRDEIWTEPWKDPSLFPDCLSHVVARLGELALEPELVLGPIAHPYPMRDPEFVAEWATDLLRELYDRSKSGVPFGEPAWGDQPPPPEDEKL
jgi:hypothetical protein